MDVNETQLLFTEENTDTHRSLQMSGNSANKPKLTVDKCTQTREANITFSEIGSENKLSYSTRDLPYLNYYRNREISDPRNEDMARIILYELERLPENHRITAFMAMFNELKKKQDEVSSYSVTEEEENPEEVKKTILKLRVMKNVEKLLCINKE